MIGSMAESESLETTGWHEIRTRRSGPAVTAGYERARRAYELGCQVRTLREERGLSQAELARRAGTSQAAVARLEAGAVEPRLSTLDRIGGVLGAHLVVELRT